MIGKAFSYLNNLSAQVTEIAAEISQDNQPIAYSQDELKTCSDLYPDRSVPFTDMKHQSLRCNSIFMEEVLRSSPNTQIAGTGNLGAIVTAASLFLTGCIKKYDDSSLDPLEPLELPNYEQLPPIPDSALFTDCHNPTETRLFQGVFQAICSPTNTDLSFSIQSYNAQAGTELRRFNIQSQIQNPTKYIVDQFVSDHRNLEAGDLAELEERLETINSTGTEAVLAKKFNNNEKMLVVFRHSLEWEGEVFHFSEIQILDISEKDDNGSSTIISQRELVNFSNPSMSSVQLSANSHDLDSIEIIKTTHGYSLLATTQKYFLTERGMQAQENKESILLNLNRELFESFGPSSISDYALDGTIEQSKQSYSIANAFQLLISSSQEYPIATREYSLAINIDGPINDPLNNPNNSKDLLISLIDANGNSSQTASIAILGNNSEDFIPLRTASASFLQNKRLFIASKNGIAIVDFNPINSAITRVEENPQETYINTSEIFNQQIIDKIQTQTIDFNNNLEIKKIFPDAQNPNFVFIVTEDNKIFSLDIESETTQKVEVSGLDSSDEITAILADSSSNTAIAQVKTSSGALEYRYLSLESVLN